MRRGSSGGNVEVKKPINARSGVVEYGGVFTAYDFPAFAEDQTQTQLVSSYGGNNWIYNANHTTRFRYAQGKWQREPTIFRGQWGITQDDFGQRYHNYNSVALYTDVIPAE